MISRRSLLMQAAVLGVGGAPSLAQGAPKRVGVMPSYSEGDAEGQARLGAFLRAMREFGWQEGRNIRYDVRWHAGNLAKAREDARELIALSPDVLLVNGTIGMTVMREMAPAIPIAFVVVADPVGAGFVQTLSRPGGRATGFSSFEPELGPKWLELIRTIAPGTRRLGVLSDPSVQGFQRIRLAIDEAAPRFGLAVEDISGRDRAEIAAGVQRALATPYTGLVVMPAAVNSVERATIRGIAAERRAPAIYPFAFHAREGGLMAYGFDGVDLFRRAGAYVSRMLNGESPANLPVQAPTKFELVVNQKTAREIGLEVPPLLLAQADEVVE